MRLKLDENLGTRTQDLFCAQGHDVQTVRSQELQGCADAHLYEACCQEQRCLVTAQTLALSWPRSRRTKRMRIEVTGED